MVWRELLVAVEGAATVEVFSERVSGKSGQLWGKTEHSGGRADGVTVWEKGGKGCVQEGIFKLCELQFVAQGKNLLQK